MKVLVVAMLGLVCIVVAAQPKSEPINAFELADWQKAGTTKQKLSERYVLTAYKSLRDKGAVCMPQGRT